MNEIDVVFTGKLFGITHDNEKVDMKMNLEDHDIPSLMSQAKTCVGFLKSSTYKDFEMEIGTKIPVKSVIVKED